MQNHPKFIAMKGAGTGQASAKQRLPSAENWVGKVSQLSIKGPFTTPFLILRLTAILGWEVVARFRTSSAWVNSQWAMVNGQWSMGDSPTCIVFACAKGHRVLLLRANPS